MDASRRIDIMGIVNLTDNSYFSASRCLGENGDVDIQKALSRAETLVAEGATILDIGACSTRPGSEPVGEAEEWRRLKAFLPVLRERFPHVLISIDTYWASVVRNVHSLIGDFIVNDVSAGEDDPDMLRTVGELGLQYVAMHKRGDSKTMQSLTGYDDVCAEIHSYFEEFAAKARRFGIHDWILDPGFGFAKTVEQNYELMRGLSGFADFRRRILVGVSRKSMIYKKFGITPEEALPATQALHLAALIGGADILRVHDAAPAVQTVEIYRELYAEK
ncbi:MAG: dihydropteroate synthase [Bacteroidales bacterium]|nr:dihydropteroate synthase [Bacteroidales bacterium]